MEQIKVDIYKSLKTNRLITLAVIIASTIISSIAILTVVKHSKETNKFIYGISTDSKMMPLERLEKRDFALIFQKGHIDLFVSYFYNYDQWNYEDRIEKALWLINDDGKKLYFFYKDNGHYNKLIQSNTSQKVENIKVQLDNKGNFICEFIIELNKIGQQETEFYKIVSKGVLISVSQNYPKNPYGYLITNYKEVSKIKIEQ